VCAAAPYWPEAALGLGLHPTATTYATTLELAAALATVGALFTRRLGPILWAFLGEIALYYLTGYLKSSTPELAELHAIWIGLVIGLHRAPGFGAPRTARVPNERHADWLWFAIGTCVGIVSSLVVLERRLGSSDEWAYTYQAAVFAKLHAYAQEPRCSYAFQNFWVYPYMGRQFSQYTPGWPYFMAPFIWIRQPWLAGPVCFGVLCAGMARLGRRVMSLADDGTTTRREIVSAGHFAAFVTAASSTLVINAGSRFSHLFVLACWIFALEALLLIADPQRRPDDRHARRWGAVLGACCALLLSTRPVDGAGLGVGLFVYFVWALGHRRFSAKTVGAVAVAFALIGGLTLIILRLQLGKWFKTGYSINGMIHPWNKFSLVTPKADDWRWGFPVATGSYVWWPCSIAVGLAGLASLGRRGRALNTMLFFGLAPVLVFYAFLDLGRGFDWGYGPRYQMVAMVPMALGTGVVLARLASRERVAFGAALAVILVGIVRIAPLVYPYEHAAVDQENRLERALDEAHVHHALVIASPGTGGVDPMDLTKNLPLDLYPDQDVVVAVSRTPHLAQCARDMFPDRAIWDASGRQTVVLQRER